MSFEASRKHGPFDLRWPVLRPRTSTRHLVLVPTNPVSASVEAAADAGAARLLAAVDAVDVGADQRGSLGGVGARVSRIVPRPRSSSE